MKLFPFAIEDTQCDFSALYVRSLCRLWTHFPIQMPNYVQYIKQLQHAQGFMVKQMWITGSPIISFFIGNVMRRSSPTGTLDAGSTSHLYMLISQLVPLILVGGLGWLSFYWLKNWWILPTLVRANYVCSCSLAWSETGVMETYLSHYHMEQGKFLQGMISLTFGTTNSCIISMFQEKKSGCFPMWKK